MNRMIDIVELSATDLGQISGAGMDGIMRLTTVTQVKVSNVTSRKSGEGQKEFVTSTTWSDLGREILVAGASAL